MRATAELSSGTLVGDRYWVQRTLGYGSCGCTYLVCDRHPESATVGEDLSQLYVLKEFAPADSRESVIDKCRALFEQEAQVLCKLKHSQIPQCFGFFEDNGRLFLVQEYINGKTYSEILQERLEQGQMFTVAQAVKWLKDLLPVLDYIHSCRIVHRDISPDNIMFPHGGKKPVLIDFGVVKQVMTQIGSQITSPPSSSLRGTLVGKVGYSPPEQLRLGQCYPNSDLYSLAVTALVLIAGKHPSELCDGYSLKWQWSKYINLGDRLGRIFDKMLAETPKERYQSARAVLAALLTVSTEELANASTVPIAQESQPTRTWNEDDTWVARSYARRSPIVTTSQPKRNTIIQSQKTVIQSEAKKTPVKLSPPPPSMRFLAMGILISSSLVGGFTLAKQSPNLALVCELLNNCADNQQLTAIARESISPKDNLEAYQFKQSKEPQNFPTPFVEESESDRTESSDRQKELLDKVQSLQSQVARLIEGNERQQAETVENAPKNQLEQAIDPRPSASPSSSSESPKSFGHATRTETLRERAASEKLIDSARSILTSEKPKPTYHPPQTTQTPAQREIKPPKKTQPQASAPEPKPATPEQATQPPESKPATPQKVQSQAPAPEPKLATPEASAPAPRTKNPPAQTYQPGFWQPVARINPKHPFKIKLVNQTNTAIEYALTTNEFAPRQLSSKESAVLTYIPLDGYLLINSTQSSQSAEVPTSLQFEVTVSGNVATVSIRQERSDRPADSTINVNQSGAIYIF
ncbi:MAG: protein kinase [Hydrococcus sp. Prado102]|nr:protein kinase [Hydrococcus sp. Prado102]